MKNHLLYCQPGVDFYDRRVARDEERFSIAYDSRPDGWSTSSDEGRTSLFPANFRSRNQGWKIRVSVTIDEADEALKILDGLSGSLVGRQGPDILSDLRRGDGPRYVRYGGSGRALGTLSDDSSDSASVG